MNKTFCIGDIHGGYKALLQCLERSGFNYKEDKLICLGDITDGWPETFECVEELFKIKNLVYVLGNHDEWLMDWLEFGGTPSSWVLQGGKAAIESYLDHYKPTRLKRHLGLFKYKARNYYIDDKNRIFVHGGISQMSIHPRDCDKGFLLWDRGLWDNRHNLEDVENLKQFKEIYVGHTSIWNISHYPQNHANVWFMDTGGGWEGKLSIINIDTKKFYQSDEVFSLYPDHRGRR